MEISSLNVQKTKECEQMSVIMQPFEIDPLPPIPEETRQAAWYVFRKNNFYITVGDRGNGLFAGATPVDPIPGGTIPLQTLAILNLVTIFQYIETIPDLQVSDSLGQRVDWKYALHMALQDTGIPAAVICEFRKRLWGNQDGQKIMDVLLERLSEIAWETRQQHLPLHTADLLDRVCLISRVAMVWVAMNDALGSLAIHDPEWLSGITQPHWYQRYSQRQTNLSLTINQAEQQDFVEEIGIDGVNLLNAIKIIGDPGMSYLPEVEALERIWADQFTQAGGRLRWSEKSCANCPRTAQHYKSTESID